MSELFGLVREFPIGSLVVILSALWATERTIKAIVSYNKPASCCDEDCTCRSSSDE